jgi:hypothetical protein
VTIGTKGAYERVFHRQPRPGVAATDHGRGPRVPARARVDALLLDAPETLVEILYRLGRAEGVASPDEFAALFDGPALWSGSCGLVGAVIDFFPFPSVAAKLRTAFAKTMEPTTEADPEPTLNLSAGTPPELPESIPADSPSAN